MTKEQSIIKSLTHYKSAVETLDTLQRDFEAEQRKLQDESNVVYQKYAELERELYNKRTAEENAIRDNKTKSRVAYDNAKIEFASAKMELDVIFDLMHIARQDKQALEPELKCYGSRIKSIKLIDTVRSTKTHIIKVFVVENEKPINRFTLYWVANSIYAGSQAIRWHAKLLGGFPYGYVSGISEVNATDKWAIKDAPTEDALIKSYERNKSHIASAWLDEHVKLDEMYGQASALLDNHEWLIAYLEHQKKYYEEGYSRGTETPEYAQVCAELEAAKASAA